MITRKIRKALSLDNIIQDKQTRVQAEQAKIQGKPTQDKEVVQDDESLSTDIERNLQILHQEFSLCSDVVFREFSIDLADSMLKVALVYVAGLNEIGLNNEFIIKSALKDNQEADSPVQASDPAQILIERLPLSTPVKPAKTWVEAVDGVVNGHILVLVNRSATAILISSSGGALRAIEEPLVEPAMRGPRDGFIESLDTNLTLLRQRLRTPNFKTEVVLLGTLSKTRIAVCYIKGLAGEKMIGEVKARLERVKVDSIQGSGDIEEYIEDETFTFFPLVHNTERPDKVTAALLEGRIGILTDTSPMALIVPNTFVSLLQAGEDYYHRAIFATSVRLLRFVTLNIALLLPGTYVAVITHHWEVLPPPLLSSLLGARSSLPLSAFSEALFMELTFEILREAGLRLPRAIGSTIGTVGGLVIGQSVVAAGLVGPGVVIVVALTALATFTLPNYEVGFSIRILRFFFLALGALLGIPGIMIGLMVLLAHLCDLRSFGVPYLSPLAPLSLRDLKDTFIRVPAWAMVARPRLFGANKPIRIQSELEPQKPDNEVNEDNNAG
ncbi:MAG: spore germination protein [Desulfitobacteriaceae bacterium]